MPKQAKHYDAAGGCTVHGPYVSISPSYPTGTQDDDNDRAHVVTWYFMSPDEARRLSADLLLAADEAEKAKP